MRTASADGPDANAWATVIKASTKAKAMISGPLPPKQLQYMLTLHCCEQHEWHDATCNAIQRQDRHLTLPAEANL